MTGFIIVYMLAAPVFGSLGDTRSRTRLIGLGVGLWSVATALAGFARSYASLFAARAAVGIGEAAYGTISPALLADYFPRERRGRGFAIFFAAIPIGTAPGYVVGGLVDHYFGWRPAFFFAGVPRVVPAVLALRLHQPPPGAPDPGRPAAPRVPAVPLRRLAAAPLTLAALAAPAPPVYWTAMVAAELLLFASTGPINSTIVNVVSPHMRATAVAVSIFTIHVLGDVPSPSLVGAISDARSLGEAVLIIPVAVLVGGIIWSYAAWRAGRVPGGGPTP